MTSISFDTYQTLAIAVIATSLGYRIKKHIRALERFCIPAPVIGGIVVATIVCILHETGMTFPMYIGSMICAAVIRNIGELSGKIDIDMDKMTDIGDIMLPLFLGIAMITMKVYDLFDLALPLMVLLLVQTILMALYARYVVFRFMGADYDAAVMVAGFCGFGMGATPNALANMKTVCMKYKPSFKAFLLVPIVGSLFADFINATVITLFLNLLRG